MAHKIFAMAPQAARAGCVRRPGPVRAQEQARCLIKEPGGGDVVPLFPDAFKAPKLSHEEREWWQDVRGAEKEMLKGVQSVVHTAHAFIADINKSAALVDALREGATSACTTPKDGISAYGDKDGRIYVCSRTDPIEYTPAWFMITELTQDARLSFIRATGKYTPYANLLSAIEARKTLPKWRKTYRAIDKMGGNVMAICRSSRNNHRNRPTRRLSARFDHNICAIASRDGQTF
jgi:hypothetical protein